jgi:hypothetical protein
VVLITVATLGLVGGLALARPAGGPGAQASVLALAAQAGTGQPGTGWPAPIPLPPAPVPQPVTARAKAAAASATARPPAATRGGAATGCAEPRCPVSFQGGAVQHQPRVYLLLWGPAWTVRSPAYVRLYAFFHGLGQAADSWSTVTSQYGAAGGAPAFGGPVLAGEYSDSSPLPNPVTQDQLAVEAQRVAGQAGITDYADSQVVVLVQSGACYGAATNANGKAVAPFAGNCGHAAATGSCGWHADATAGGSALPYVVVPYERDAGKACGENWVNPGTAGEYDGFSTVAGAEYADTITDPFGTGWYDPGDTVTAGEIGDKCAWGGKGLGYTAPKGNISLPVAVGSKTESFPFAVQSLWDNSGRCVLTSRPAISLPVPATQASTTGATVSLPVRARTNTGTSIRYTAAGLPRGLAISAGTGTITGTITVPVPGAYPVTVTAANYGAARSVRFSWRVNSRAGVVRGAVGTCLQGQGNRTASGTAVVLEPCSSTAAAEKFSLHYGGELVVGPACVTVNTRVFLYPCKNLSAQAWSWQPATGEYVLAARHECLTATSTASGARLALAACRATRAQKWSLP